MQRGSFDGDWFVRKDGRDRVVGPVTLPYDAMHHEARDPKCGNSHNTGYFPGGVYRYEKTFASPAAWRGRAVTLEFEAVYRRSEIFPNGAHVGGRPSGYARFEVSL